MDDSRLRAQLEALHKESFGWALHCSGRDREEAEVLLQSVYLRVLDGRARYSGMSSLKTWLFGVIRKTALERRRHRALYFLRFVRYDGAAFEAEARGGSQETQLYESEVQRLFRTALASLSARQREVLQLVFYHDMSLSDAASVIGISIGSARTHYDRGKKRLREILIESGAFDEFGIRREEYPETVR